MNSFLARTLMQFMRPQRVQLFEQLLQNQWLPAERITEENRSRLGQLLGHAAHVPFYRERCLEAGLDPDRITDGDLLRFPLVSKSIMMADTPSFRNEAAEPDRFYANATGGSAGTWFEFFIDRNALEVRTANDLRGRTWTGWGLGYKRLGGLLLWVLLRFDCRLRPQFEAFLERLQGCHSVHATTT